MSHPVLGVHWKGDNLPFDCGARERKAGATRLPAIVEQLQFCTLRDYLSAGKSLEVVLELVGLEDGHELALLAISVGSERRHGIHTLGASNLLAVVNVHGHEFDARIGLAERLEGLHHRRAGSGPAGGEEDHHLLVVLDNGGELVLLHHGSHGRVLRAAGTGRRLAKVINALGGVRGDETDNGLEISALDHLLHLALGVELEGGHGRDALALAQLSGLVHIHLAKLHIGEMLRKLVNLGGHHLARAAPRGEEVNHGVAGLDEGVILGRGTEDSHGGLLFGEIQGGQ